MKDMGDLLLAIRRQRNFNQTEMGEILGCDQSYVSQIERGVTTPSKMLAKVIEDYVRRTRFKIKRAK